MTRFMLIVNPISGRGNGEKSYPEIEKRLNKMQLDTEVRMTEYVGHASQLAQQAAEAGWDVVVAVGGDGTSNEVLNGLVNARLQNGSQAAMGLIPVGRGNDFGYGIDVPHDLDIACQVLADGTRKWIDVGFLKGGDFPDGRYFGNGVGIGFDAVVGFEAVKLKRLSGFPSYIVAALKTMLLYFNAPLLRIELDGETLEQAALMVSIMNGRRLGGGFMMAPQGEINDGFFDICIAGQVSRTKILTLIPRFMQGSQFGDPAIRAARTSQLIVTALDGSLPVHADGETICIAGKQLELRILPKTLEVLVPSAT